MSHLFNYLATIITEGITGLDHKHLKFWEFYTYMNTLTKVECAMRFTLKCFVVIAVCVVGYVVIKKKLGKNKTLRIEGS